MRNVSLVAQAMADAITSGSKAPYAQRLIEALAQSDVFVVDAATLKDTLRANMFDGAYGGRTTMDIETLLTDVVDIVRETFGE